MNLKLKVKRSRQKLVLVYLISCIEKPGPELSDDAVHLQLQAVSISQEDTHAAVVIDTPKLKIKPRGRNQLSYIDAIRSHDVNFGIGQRAQEKRGWESPVLSKRFGLTKLNVLS